ncbi:hypothetical protein ACFX10_030680 [Malus domestica]
MQVLAIPNIILHSKAHTSTPPIPNSTRLWLIKHLLSIDFAEIRPLKREIPHAQAHTRPGVSANPASADCFRMRGKLGRRPIAGVVAPPGGGQQRRRRR